MTFALDPRIVKPLDGTPDLNDVMHQCGGRMVLAGKWLQHTTGHCMAVFRCRDCDGKITATVTFTAT